jgi:hypothetical protein
MIEVFGDLWDYKADAKCITTNGFIRKDGAAVMGRGTAKQAAKLWPELPSVLGELLKEGGNGVYIIGSPPRMDFHLIAFPVKENFWEKADLGLIERSAVNLVLLTEKSNWQTVVLPRPGCGNGQRKWEEVRPILESILDDRFHIIDLEE